MIRLGASRSLMPAPVSVAHHPLPVAAITGGQMADAIGGGNYRRSRAFIRRGPTLVNTHCLEYT